MNNPKRLFAISLLLVLSLLVSACGIFGNARSGTSDFDDSLDGNTSALGEPVFDEAESAIAADTAPQAEEFRAGEDAVAQSVERLVIKNADLSIVVDNPGNTQDAIAAMAEGMGGFVVSSNLYQTSTATGLEVPAASITVRVPSEQLQEALTNIEDMAVRVVSQNQSGQDVTAQYTDLQSRLRNLEDAEVLLRQIMDEARDTEDVLTAFNQLNNITSQIEVLKGQIQYFEESAALSAISVQLIASAAEQPISVGGWEPEGVAKDALQALISALQGLANAVIWFAIYLLPILLLVGVPLYFIVRGLRGWWQKRQTG